MISKLQKRRRHRSGFTLVFSFVLLDVFLATACGVAVVDDNEAKPPPAPVTAQAQSEEPEYQFIALSEPNRYQVRFRPDLQARLISYQLEGQSPVSVSPAPDSFLGGKTYQFNFRNETTGGNEVRSLRFPQDLVLDRAYSYEEKPTPALPVVGALSPGKWTIQTDGRLFLRRSATLTTHGASTLLQASEILSEGALIQTFEANAVAVLAQNGRHGGQISVQALKISGKLIVTLRGESGGKGRPGAPYPTRARKGTSYEGGIQSAWPSCQDVHPGGDGEPGLPGHPGHGGANGGDSGDLLLEVQDRSQLDLQTEVIIGAAGPGGDGGPGQQGGEGGDSGHKPVSEPSPHGMWRPISFGIPMTPGAPVFRPCGEKRGRDGRNGDPGSVGAPGRPGLRGRICEIQTSKMQCR